MRISLIMGHYSAEDILVNYGLGITRAKGIKEANHSAEADLQLRRLHSGPPQWRADTVVRGV